jgi:hypothetical protein
MYIDLITRFFVDVLVLPRVELDTSRVCVGMECLGKGCKEVRWFRSCLSACVNVCIYHTALRSFVKRWFS